MKKIDQIFDEIHDYVCDKNATALDPQQKKKTFYIKDLQYRSAKNIEDIRQNTLLKISTLGGVWLLFDTTPTIDSIAKGIIATGYAFYPFLRDKITNDKGMRDFYTILGTWLMLWSLTYIAETSDIDVGVLTNFLSWFYLIYWINSSDQPKRRKRWSQDESLKQKLLDLIKPLPIATKAKTSEI